MTLYFLGCPPGQSPVRGPDNDIIPCFDHSTTSHCPERSSCLFNFWTASYQCCEANNEVCLMGEIPYLRADSSRPMACQTDFDCPNRFHCSQKSDVCCGETGKCPHLNDRPLKDDLGRLRTCSISSSEACPEDSSCVEAVSSDGSDLPTGQFICCSSSLFSCQLSGVPFPSAENPQQCNLENPIACPMDMLCQSSNIAGVSICCTDEVASRKLCPKGWHPRDDLIIVSEVVESSVREISCFNGDSDTLLKNIEDQIRVQSTLYIASPNPTRTQ
uniref:WAP domain-containing protein n=1 Tax=Ditylenchus dipsaci TaxID=166011 RepID=A0A915CUA9_9BILA